MSAESPEEVLQSLRSRRAEVGRTFDSLARASRTLAEALESGDRAWPQDAAQAVSEQLVVAERAFQALVRDARRLEEALNSPGVARTFDSLSAIEASLEASQALLRSTQRLRDDAASVLRTARRLVLVKGGATSAALQRLHEEAMRLLRELAEGELGEAVCTALLAGDHRVGAAVLLTTRTEGLDNEAWDRCEAALREDAELHRLVLRGQLEVGDETVDAQACEAPEVLPPRGDTHSPPPLTLDRIESAAVEANGAPNSKAEPADEPHTAEDSGRATFGGAPVPNTPVTSSGAVEPGSEHSTGGASVVEQGTSTEVSEPDAAEDTEPNQFEAMDDEEDLSSPPAPGPSPERESAGSPSREAAKVARTEGLQRSDSGRWQVPSLPRLSPALESYQSFRERNWIHPERAVCETPPWVQNAAAHRVGTVGALRECVERLDVAQAWVHARALEELGDPALVHSCDLEAAGVLLSQPASPYSGRDESRPARLRAGLLGQDCPKPRAMSFRLGIVLEALRPAAESRIVWDEVDPLLHAVGFRTPALQTVAGELLRLSAKGVDAIPRIQEALGQVPRRTARELKIALAQRRLELHQFVRRVWSGAGGRIQRTHCREAWDEFLSQVHGDLSTLFPEDEQGKPLERWAVPQLEAKLRRLPKVHERIADRRQARHVDRRIMDQTVLELQASALSVLAALREFKEAESAPASRDGTWPLAELRDLEGCERLEDVEELCRQLVLRAFAKDPQRNDALLAVTLAEVLRRPLLLECLPADLGIDLATARATDVLAPVTAVADPILASVLWALPPAPVSDGESRPIDALREQLDDRLDLLLRLLPALRDPDKRALLDRRADWHQRLWALETRLRTQWQILEDLAHPDHLILNQICMQVLAIEDLAAGALPVPALVEAWLAEVSKEAEHVLRHMRDLLHRDIAMQPESEARSLALRALEAGRFGEASRLLRRGEGYDQPPRVRETEWRSAAASRVPKPDAELKKLSTSRKAVQAWRKGIQGTYQDRGLRRAFFELAFDGLPSPAYTVDDKSRIEISCRALRQHLANQRKNPCFLPQLRRFENVVILTPEGRISPQFPTRVADQAAKVQNSLVLLLAPRLDGQVRNLTIREMHRRGLTAAVFDDLDLARLVSESQAPDPLIGTFEIALEQLPWQLVDPFESTDGQNVTMEMYVGRRREAQELATQAKYSRLFSGRKLGKSALLRYVEEAADKVLPSGQDLVVVYVPVAGIESEHLIVDKVLAELEARCGFASSAPNGGKSPAQRLESVLRRYQEVNPKTSLLFVLDEADVFVEGQLDQYDQGNERCLTFQIRTVIESQKDSMGHPRARFVFAGYRKTNTRGGAWGNYGDVLILKPLEPDDAASLVAGPLAKLGIDAVAQAHAIAHRCGFQPAVLIRFGERLLEVMSGRRGRNLDGPFVVEEQDVLQVFASSHVQEEIRTVVRNNFQGNRMGQIVFNALLLEFQNAPSFLSIDDLAGRIGDRLRALADKAMRPDGAEAPAAPRLDEIQLLLREFVERRLICEETVGTQAWYRLMHPHHLPVLMTTGLESATLTELEQARSSGSVASGVRVRSLVGDRTIERVAQGLQIRSERSDMPLIGVVFASLWPEAMLDEAACVPTRLGFDRHTSLVSGRESGLAKIASTAECLAAWGVTPVHAEQILAARPGSLQPPVLFGGGDLLRWALENELWDRDGREGFLDVVAVGRFSRLTLEWWFTRVRCYEFETGALQLIERETSGIPLLVGLFDSTLNGSFGTGVTLSKAQFERVSAEYRQRRDEHLQKRLPEVALLSPRAQEILEMALLASRTDLWGPGVSIREGLVDASLWGEDGLIPAKRDYPLVGPGDRLDLEVLTRLGVLPALPSEGPSLERLVKVPPDDAAHHIAQALGRRVS